MKFKTVEWKGDRVRILDQRELPQKICYLNCRNASDVARAIRSMAIRGAPAIGVAAAMGVALAAQKIPDRSSGVFRRTLERICDEMNQTRPTAVNLFWAVDRMRHLLDALSQEGVEKIRKKLVMEAMRIYREDIEVNKKIGEHGKKIIQDGYTVLTHCNAGALATAGFGTALGVIYAAKAEGKKFRVMAGETRPLLQGARLTAWELSREKIPVTVITDSMAGWFMKKRMIDLVLIGADRIARNGDTANKIGTYSLAVLSRYHKIPFYVVAPTSTIDLSLPSGKEIPIEERKSEEVTHLHGYSIVPRGVKAFNPAFDVTPYSFLQGIITEKGLIRAPYEKNLKRIMD